MNTDSKTIEELACQAKAIVEKVRQSSHPITIIENGKPVAVLLDAAQYENMVQLLELSRLLAQGEASIRAGKSRPAEDVFKEILGEDRRAEKTPRGTRSRRRS